MIWPIAAAALLAGTTTASELKYIISGSNCLTSNQAAMFLSPCLSASVSQQFDLGSNKLQINSLCVDSELNLGSCMSTTSNWWFYPDGRVMSQQLGPDGCLGQDETGKLRVVSCGSGTQVLKFATVPVIAPPPPGSQLPSATSLPMVTPPATPVVTSQIPVDHYLCTCIVDAMDESCDSAVKSACLVGHLNSEWCKESFNKGNHDKISDQILILLGNGDKCKGFDVHALRKQQREHAQRTGEVSLQGTPSKMDHYLCVCLDENEPQKCQFAIQAACLVGHIPAGDCAASLQRNDHEGASMHVLKLIDQGATCSQKLVQTAMSTGNDKKKSFMGKVTSMFSLRKQREITAEDKDLCYCLDAFDSVECIKAVARACKGNKIPKEDCEASSKDYTGGTTKHVLRLIDHGADCPAHRSMTFTNHGCHCMQSWTQGKQLLTFPDNCADPNGERGFAWCKTYPNEHCAGVQGSVEWDRCDAPKYPTYQNEASSKEDHYLCVCLADTSTDEVCVAAVKAACQVGHLPSEQCKESFETLNHAKVSDSILQLLENGKKCDVQTMQKLLSKVQRASSSSSTGCEEGFFGFPNCRRKVPCAEKCKGRGNTCDLDTGTCVCLPNFVGKFCSRCADGTSGRHCLPDSEQFVGEWWWGALQVLMVLTLAYCTMKRCCSWSTLTRIKMCCSLAGIKHWWATRKTQPSTLAQKAEYGVIPPEAMEEQDYVDADLGTDEKPLAPLPKSDKVYSGLAV
ncbi:hypothetical protein BASA81_004491 [Batrachochytrium salamandrivorans]|nr:hypothetical protein BASA81_004491 [Batrachochytrium salamandrivorans]